MESKIILGRILQRLIDQGFAQVPGYNKFYFIKMNNGKIWVTREKGKDTPISFERILAGIEAYKGAPDLYFNGPSGLRDFGITHITSPVFALLHLLSQTDYE